MSTTKITVYRGTAEHEELLNGLRLYPDMLGYAVGFHLVQDCIAHKKINNKAAANDGRKGNFAGGSFLFNMNVSRT
ncbi:hypothetical protein GCM10020331_078750 [Ectobacillus funiculus]